MTRFIKLCAFRRIAAALVMSSLCASAASLGAKVDPWPLPTDGTWQTHVTSEGESHYFKFTVGAYTACLIETRGTGSGSCGATTVYLYDADWTLLAADEQAGSGLNCAFGKITYVFPDAGTYFIRVIGGGGGEYMISVRTLETIHGRVTDGENPMENVGIWIVPASKAYDEPIGAAKTDASGMYCCLVPDGTHTVTARLHGYACSPAFRELTVPGDSTADFTMSPVVREGDGVTTSWAVLVGISDYWGKYNDVTGDPEPDIVAADFAHALATAHNWQDSNIEILLNRQATAAAIWAALQRMATNADADDLCLFLFAGRGKTGADEPPLDEGGGGDEYLRETDLRHDIRDDVLAEWIATLPTQKAMVVLSAAYSGGFIKGTPGAKGLGHRDPPSAPRNGFAEDLLRAMAAKTAMQPKDLDDNGYGVVITATDDDEYPGPYPGAYPVNGFHLPNQMVSGMLHPDQSESDPYPAADADGDGWITAEEIYPHAVAWAAELDGTHAQLYDADPGTPFPYFHHALIPHTLTITDGPSGDPIPVASASQVLCFVTAQDSRGHALIYQWTAEDGEGNPAGSFDDSSAQDPDWTAPDNTSDAVTEYLITVTVRCRTNCAVTETASYTQRVFGVHLVEITAGPCGDPNPVASGGQVQCSVTAADSHEHTMTYQWTVDDAHGDPAGSFDDSSAQNPTWTAPDNTSDAVTEYLITVTATCSEHDSVTASYTQQVSPVEHTVTITEGPSGDPNPVASGGQVQCSATGQDSLGHALTYQWTVDDAHGDPAGSFDDAAAQSPTWTAPVVSSPSDYTIAVTVSCSADASVAAGGSLAQRVLPALTHTFPGEVLMVGTPIEPHFAGSMEALLGAEAVACWDAAAQDYYTQTSPSAVCSLGEGCWARFVSQQVVEVAGTPCLDDLFRWQAQPEWNLIALPWSQNVPISAMSHDPAGEMPCFAWTYYDGDYHLVAPLDGIPGVETDLEPWRGYWVFAESECEVILDRGATASSTKTMSVADRSRDDVWLIQLVASAGGARDSANYCGISPQGDALDIPNPPAALGKVDLYFVAGNGTRKALDFRVGSPSATYEWEFEVAGPRVGEQVRVACPDLSSLPTRYKAYLVDREASKTVYLRTTTGYDYAASSAVPRHFTFRVVEDGDRSLMVTGVVAQQLSAGQATVSLTLSAPASVTITICNIAGRRLRRIAEDHPLPAGLRTTVWDLRDDGGTLVPSGLYLVQVTALAEDGAQASAITATAVRR